MPSTQSIQLFITGGTIDKQYEATTGTLNFPATHLPQLLQEANSTLDIPIQVLMQKDSLEMTEQDRELIDQACSNSKSQMIVITHGTDTMVETALSLLQHAITHNYSNKTIILTGAMRPFMLQHSDASFNIGAALMAVQLTPAGVYICMNGQIFNAEQVQKDRQQGIFKPI
ncbi:MAG: asparaginase domain-containing protein [Thiomicrorhabdus sp.]|jgi:L-asparaginase|nr:asparaginase domain-containing protein [Thiomicrorhabdus sp.]